MKRLLKEPTTWILTVLGAVTALAYSNHFAGEFHFDGRVYLLENEALRSWDTLPQVLRENIERPLLWLTFFLNHRWSGYETWSWHLVNWCMHLANVFWVYALVGLIFSKKAKPERRVIAFSSALLFAVHPLQTESVAYIISRSELMLANFYLGSLYFWLQFRRQNIRGYWALSWVFFILALGVKQSAVTLPVLILCFEFFMPGGDDVSLKKLLKQTLAPFFGVLLVYLFLRAVLMGSLGNPATDQISHAATYPLTQMGVLMRYLGLIFFPFELNIDPDVSPAGSLLEWRVMLAALFHASMLWLAWHLRRLKPQWGLAILWFYLTISPTSSLVALRDVMAEHRVYLPIIGILWLMSAAVFWLSNYYASRLTFFRMSQARRGIFLGLLFISFLSLFFVGKTFERNRDYRDGLRLWLDTVKKSPKKYRPHYNLANAYYRMGRYSEALPHYDQALEARPDFLPAYFNRGNTYRMMDRREPSLADYQKVLDIDPDFYRAWYNMGIVLQKLGETEQSRQAFEQVLRLRPGYSEALNAIGVGYFQRGKYNDAKRYFSQVLEMLPQHFGANLNMGLCFFNAGDFQSALLYLQQAVNISPREIQAVLMLAACRLKLRRDVGKTQILLKNLLKHHPQLANHREFNDLQKGLNALAKSASKTPRATH